MKLNTVHTTLPVADLDRAKKFYREKFGLSPSTEEPGGVFYEVGPTRFLVFPTSGRASGEHTQMGFTVDDIESAVAELKSRGVVFEEYDFPGLKTVGSVATTGPIRAAWFKDSEGNLLGLVQLVASSAWEAGLQADDMRVRMQVVIESTTTVQRPCTR